MDRRHFLKAGANGYLAWTVFGGVQKLHAKQCDLKAAKKPNVVFIFADDLGWGDLGCYGHPELKTPNLDKLARQGKQFTQFYVNAPFCSPSRAAVMTGNYPARHNIHFWLGLQKHNEEHGCSNYLSPDAPNIAGLLQKAGYTTAHYGKWHLGETDDAPPVSEYGFDDVKVLCQGKGPRIGTDCGDPKGTELLVDTAIEFVKHAQQQKKPFYINLWPRDVHAALRPSEESLAKYEHLKSMRKFKTPLQIYYAAVTEMDVQLGRLFEAIDNSGLGEDTIIVFASDNGPEDIHVPHASYHAVGSSGPFRGRKRSLYEGGIRMPFIVRWTGHVPAGIVDNTSIVSGVDLLPTFCKLATARVPNDYISDGEDMTSALLQKSFTRKKPLMWEYRFHNPGHPIDKSPQLAIRQNQWKLLINPDKSRIELYDIVNDPMELNNLADRNKDIVEELSRKVLTWKKTLPIGPVGKTCGKADYPWPE